MEIIHIHHPYDQKQIPDEQIVLALGYFDGVHRGHQEVIKRAKEIAENKNLKLAVMSFNHHPSIVFQKMNPETMQYLSTINRKAEIFENLGVDYFFVVSFTSAFASLRPQEFVDQYICGLHASAVVVRARARGLDVRSRGQKAHEVAAGRKATGEVLGRLPLPFTLAHEGLVVFDPHLGG